MCYKRTKYKSNGPKCTLSAGHNTEAHWEGGGEKVFPGPMTFGGPCHHSKILQRTPFAVFLSDGKAPQMSWGPGKLSPLPPLRWLFFLTSNMHKIHFWPGLCPGPCWGSLRRSSILLVGWWGDMPLRVSSLAEVDLSAQNEIVIGPRDNAWFPRTRCGSQQAWQYHVYRVTVCILSVAQNSSLHSIIPWLFCWC